MSKNNHPDNPPSSSPGGGNYPRMSRVMSLAIYNAEAALNPNADLRAIRESRGNIAEHRREAQTVVRAAVHGHTPLRRDLPMVLGLD